MTKTTGTQAPPFDPELAAVLASWREMIGARTSWRRRTLGY